MAAKPRQSAAALPRVGDKLVLCLDKEVGAKLVGTCRFAGKTEFAAGNWVGVELSVAEGKNDGSVQGKRYFTCPARHGLFLKPAAVKPYTDGAAAKADGGPKPRRPATERRPVGGRGFDELRMGSDATGEIEVEEVDGARSELLEILFKHLSGGRPHIGLTAFSRFVTFVDSEVDEASVPEMFAQLSAATVSGDAGAGPAADAPGQGVDFLCFAEVCGPRGLKVSGAALAKAAELQCEQWQAPGALAADDGSFAMALAGRGRGLDAALLWRGVLKVSVEVLQRRRLAAEHPMTMLRESGNLQWAMGRFEDAQCRLGAEHPDALRALGNLALALGDVGRRGDAELLERRCLEASERCLGPEHPDTLEALGNLALTLGALGRHGDAEPLQRRGLEASERRLGAEHPDTLRALGQLALTLGALGRHGDAEPLQRRCAEVSERCLGLEQPDTLRALGQLALTLSALGRHVEAEALERRRLEASERHLGPEDPDTLEALESLAATLSALGRHSEAEPLLRRRLQVSERCVGRKTRTRWRRSGA